MMRRGDQYTSSHFNREFGILTTFGMVAEHGE
jgi:hypothetical protein